MVMILVLTGLSVGGIVIGVLYFTTFKEQTATLTRVVRGQAHLVERLANERGVDLNQDNHLDECALVRKMLEIVQGIDLGDSGEFVLGRKNGDQVEFLFPSSQLDNTIPPPVDFGNFLAVPMQNALMGLSGVGIETDYRGEKVLAAYQPVGVFGWGLVAKKDVKELRAPFVHAASVAGSVGMVIIVLGVVLFRWIGQPVLRRLEDSEKKYRDLFEFANDGILLIDLGKLVVQDVNWLAARQLGYAREELLGLDVREISVSDPTEEAEDCFLRLMQADGLVCNHLFRCKDGSRIFVEISARRLSLGGVQGVQWLVRDITERKKIEHELLRHRENLEEMVQQRTDELRKARDAAEEGARTRESFLINMSHEIRTPMNGVLGMADLILKTSLSQQQRHYVETIHRSGRTLLRIINDILDFSKIQAGRLTLERLQFDLDVVILDIRNLFLQRARSRGLTFELRVVEGVPSRLVGDPYRLNQVLFNLVGNAIKFTERGTVVLSVDLLELHEENVLLRFHVQDSGIGISEEFQRNMFQAFSQEDTSVARRFGGTGLGLAITQRLLCLMGSRLEVESVVGQGAKFWFEVRFDRPQPGDQEGMGVWQQARQSVIDANTMFTGNILLVEDNLVNQEVAAATLESFGCRVTVAGDGRHALHLLCESDCSFDIVFMDCEMPVLDGIETAMRVRSWERQNGKPGVPIIALTAHVLKESRHRCLDAGMNDFLRKPFSPSDVGEMLHRWLPPERAVIHEKKESDPLALFFLDQATSLDATPSDHGGGMMASDPLVAFSLDQATDPDATSAEHGGMKDGGMEEIFAMPVLDRETLGHIDELSSKRGNDLLEKMVGHFTQRTPLLLAELNAAIERGDGEGVRVAAHTLKSSGLVMGTQRLAGLGRAMENGCKDMDRARILVRQAFVVYEESFQALNELLHGPSRAMENRGAPARTRDS
ncbi:MAG: response regulator [Magnetococcales bacterium]|nr:response regulator [Magnetococcales bacterium]